ncbi:carbonic anhydrase [Nocardia salmonicida]|uniref:carbonic anhydrase n=1 Tax=Nocardia salmonicida TaxID=53431 RepID=UPI003628BB1D
MMVVFLAFTVTLMLYCALRSGIRVEERDDGWHLKIQGRLLSRSKLSSVLASIPPRVAVHVDVTAPDLGDSLVATINNWQENYEKDGGVVLVHEIGRSWLSTGLSTVDRRDVVTSGARSPRTLLITCADSRIEPKMIGATGPGEMIVVRSSGNIVPARGARASSGPLIDTTVAAAVDFAVEELGVDDIVVCGHSVCGAMSSALREVHEGIAESSEWIEQARPSVARMSEGRPAPVLDPTPVEDSGSVVDDLSKYNVVQQLEHLRTYPAVVAAERAGRLRLAGMYFEIATARMHLINQR